MSASPAMTIDTMWWWASHYDEILFRWNFMFPLTCGFMMWVSVGLSLLVLIADGRQKQAQALQAIEQLVASAPTKRRLRVVRSSVPGGSSSRSTSPQSTSSSASFSSSRAAMTSTSTASCCDTAAAAGTASSSRSGSNSTHSSAPHPPPAAPQQQQQKTSGGDLPDEGGTADDYVDVRATTVPIAYHLAAMPVKHRAVVVVGGDFARSPRMQYHAMSLAASGQFDQVTLVGFFEGNTLSEALLHAGDPHEQEFIVWEGKTRYLREFVVVKQVNDETGDMEDVLLAPQSAAVHGVEPSMLHTTSTPRRRHDGCQLNLRYLIHPPQPPRWLSWVPGFLQWYVLCLYRVVSQCLLFFWCLLCVVALRVNSQGQVEVTTTVLFQTPSCVPVLVGKLFVRPFAAVYSFLFYIGVFAPFSLLNIDGMAAVGRCMKVHRSESMAVVVPPRGSTTLPQLFDALYAVPRQVFFPRIVVDWHNFGYTILAAAGRPGWIVALYRLFETTFCVGDVNLTVSRAMRRALLKLFVKPSAQITCHADARSTSEPRSFVASCPFNSSQHSSSSSGSSSYAGSHKMLISLDEDEEEVAAANQFYVLYDVAPSFFAPASRQEFVELVLGPVNRQSQLSSAYASYSASSASSSTPAHSHGATAANNTGHHHAPTAPASPGGGVHYEGWGLHPPPRWVYDEIPLVDQYATGSRLGSSSSSDDSYEEYDDEEDEESGSEGHTIGFRTRDANRQRGRSRARHHNHHHHRSSLSSTSSSSLPSPLPPTTLPMRKGLILIGSTSWTPDDDYSILLEALQRLDFRLCHEEKYYGRSVAAPQPLDLWVLITGKGPARAQFEKEVQSVKLSSHVVVSTVYFQSYIQYSVALGAADIGLCLHHSSSGLDLPMKGVDMLGAGLPIVALDYEALEELIGPRLPSAAAMTHGGTAADTHPLGTHYAGDSSSSSSSATNTSNTSAAAAAAATAVASSSTLVTHQFGWSFRSSRDLELLLTSFLRCHPLDPRHHPTSGLSRRVSTAMGGAHHHHHTYPRGYQQGPSPPAAATGGYHAPSSPVAFRGVGQRAPLRPVRGTSLLDAADQSYAMLQEARDRVREWRQGGGGGATPIPTSAVARHHTWEEQWESVMARILQECE